LTLIAATRRRPGRELDRYAANSQDNLFDQFAASRMFSEPDACSQSIRQETAEAEH
jgi:hypothetical protein